jgi:hypothetical protein
MAGGSSVNAGAAFPLGYMRGGLPPATLVHRIGGVVSLVDAHDDEMVARNILDHIYSSFTFRRAVFV